MKIKNIVILTKYEILKILRQPVTVFFAILFPIGWMFFNGTMYSNDPSPIFNNIGTLDYIFSSLVFIIVLVNGLSNLPLLLARNMEANIYKRYAISPMKKSEYIAALYISNLILVYLSATVLFITGKIAFDISMPHLPILFILYLGLITCAVESIGILIATFVKGFTNVMSVSFMLYFSMLFLSGASVPLEVLPSIFKELAQYNLFAYYIKVMQGFWVQGIELSIPIIFVTIFISIALIISSISWFKWGE